MANSTYPSPYRRKKGDRNSQYVFMYKTPDGKRNTRSTGTTVKNEAEAYIRKFMDELELKAASMTFGEYANRFFTETCPHARRRRQERKSFGSRQQYNCRRWLETRILTDKKLCDIRMKELKRGDLLAFRDRLIDQGIGLNTVNKCTKVIQVICSEAEYSQYITYNPASKIGDISYDAVQRGDLSCEEIRMLFSSRPGVWDDTRAYTAFYIAAFTGMRHGEVTALRWRHIDFKNGVISVHEAWKSEQVEEIGLPKWNKTRDIPAPASLLKLLKEYRDSSKYSGDDDLIICSKSGTRTKYTWWRKHFQNAISQVMIEQNGIEKRIDASARQITSHSLRHSLNTNLLRMSVNNIFVHAYLGWTFGSAIPMFGPMQQNYTHLNALDLVSVSKAIDAMYLPQISKGEPVECSRATA